MTRAAIPVTLFSPCHNLSWTASEADRQTLRALAERDAVAPTKYPQGRQPEPWESARKGAIDSATDGQCTFLPVASANN
jgi:hypothetical protein